MHRLLLQAGACNTGCVAKTRLIPYMEETRLQQAEALCPRWQSLLCAAFPYGGRAAEGSRISCYARGGDYHAVLRQRLEAAAQALSSRFPQNRFVFCADSSPFPEVAAAGLAGLGKVGKNGLLITETAGSFVFLGFLVTDGVFAETGGEIVPCSGCGACLQACPGGALQAKGDFEQRCLSALTQKRGELTHQQAALVRQGGLLWGCDRCQLACPENRHITVPPLPEFAPLPDPAEADLQLSDRQFRKTFAGRAFVWRGVQPLRRNLDILEDRKDPSHTI